MRDAYGRPKGEPATKLLANAVERAARERSRSFDYDISKHAEVMQSYNIPLGRVLEELERLAEQPTPNTLLISESGGVALAHDPNAVYDKDNDPIQVLIDDREAFAEYRSEFFKMIAERK